MNEIKVADTMLKTSEKIVVADFEQISWKTKDLNKDQVPFRQGFALAAGGSGRMVRPATAFFHQKNMDFFPSEIDFYDMGDILFAESFAT